MLEQDYGDFWDGVAEIFTNSVKKATTALKDLYDSAKLAKKNAQERIKQKAISKAIEYAIPKVKEKKKKTQYWAADSNANKIAPLTYPEAKLRISTGENILCENQIAAYAIVKPYYRGKRPEPEIHKGEGYYWHYHINMKNHGAPHIWFQGEPYI